MILECFKAFKHFIRENSS